VGDESYIQNFSDVNWKGHIQGSTEDGIQVGHSELGREYLN
jgi:hypothetical protein